MQQSIFNVTVAELANILFAIEKKDGAPFFAYIKQRTDPKPLKKDRVSKEANPYTKIVKESYVSILLNSVYERAIERQLEKEGKDISAYEKGQNTMPIEFGPNNMFIGLYDRKFVLQYRPNDNVEPKTIYIADDKEKTFAELENLLPTAKAATNQGTDREILWRKLYLHNVVELTLDHKKYIVIDGGQAV
jgi:hypothetical protein